MGFGWSNRSPRTKAFTKAPAHVPKTAYGKTPNFQQKSGVLPGQVPEIGHVTTPSGPDVPLKNRLSAFQSVFITLGH